MEVSVGRPEISVAIKSGFAEERITDGFITLGFSVTATGLSIVGIDSDRTVALFTDHLVEVDCGVASTDGEQAVLINIKKTTVILNVSYTSF